MITEATSPLFQWLSLHPELAGLATFIISAAESIAVIGTIVPGSVTMTAVGALAGAGVIPLWSTLIWAIMGAIAGDGVSYWLGFYFKDRIREIWPFRKHPNLLIVGENFFYRHGGMSVFIGRFVGPVRALVPMVAGMLGMRPLRFTFANVASAILWAPIYMLPGIVLGMASLELPSEFAARIILTFILTGLLIILLIWFLIKFLSLIQQHILNMLTRYAILLQESPYFAPLTRLFRHHNRQKSYFQSVLFLALVIVLCFLSYLTLTINYHGSNQIFANSVVFYFFRSLRSSGLDHVMLFIPALGDKHVILPLFFIIFLYFLKNRCFSLAWHTIALGGLSALSIKILKTIIISPRPWGIIHNSVDSFSFPSGHATMSFITYFAFAAILTQICSIKRQRWIYLGASIIVLLVGISRLYFGAHWLTDVIGGWLLAAAWLLTITISYNRRPAQPVNAKSFLTVSLVTLFLSYSIYTYLDFAKLKEQVTLLEWPTYTTSTDAWWQQQRGYFPLFRVNRLGLSATLFNVEWLDDFTKITQILEKNGWETPPERDWISFLDRLTSSKSNDHLPLIPPLYLSQPPALTLIKHTNEDQVLVLRLWRSYIRIQDYNDPLWVGSLEMLPQTNSWFFQHDSIPPITLSVNLIFNKLPRNYEVKMMEVELKTKARITKKPLILIRSKQS